MSGTSVAMFPPGRYGRRRDPRRARRRWIAYVVLAAVVLAGIGIAIKLFRQYTLAPYQVRIITVTDLTDTAVTVSFEVNRPAGTPALCTVLGHTRDGEVVGRALLLVDSEPVDRGLADSLDARVPASVRDRAGLRGEIISRVTYTLPTAKRAVTGEVPGCGPAS